MHLDVPILHIPRSVGAHIVRSYWQAPLSFTGQGNGKPETPQQKGGRNT